MSGHGYETGRLNLPFVGISTFGKRPYVADWSAIKADAAILGAPFDFGTQFRAGARFGPRAIREASTLFSFGHAGAYDHEDDATYLGPEVTIVDIGDADIVHTDTEKSHANIETGVRAILDAGALPVTLGGDHSINIPCIRAFAGGVRSTSCRSTRISTSSMSATASATATATRCAAAAEQDHVTGITALGIRNVSSTAKDGYDAARAMGDDILSVRQVRKLGRDGVLAHPQRRAALRHHRHRWLLPLDRAGHRHAQPRRLPLLRSA